MSVLKIKNASGKWIGIPTIKGDKGDPGEKGEAGADGTDGVTPAFRVSNGHIQVSVDNGDSWTNLVAKRRYQSVYRPTARSY